MIQACAAAVKESSDLGVSQYLPTPSYQGFLSVDRYFINVDELGNIKSSLYRQYSASVCLQTAMQNLLSPFTIES